jgi:hypothetical protein
MKKITSRQGFKHHKCEKFGYLNDNSYPLVTGFFGHCLHYSEYCVEYAFETLCERSRQQRFCNYSNGADIQRRILFDVHLIKWFKPANGS